MLCLDWRRRQRQLLQRLHQLNSSVWWALNYCPTHKLVVFLLKNFRWKIYYLGKLAKKPTNTEIPVGIFSSTISSSGTLSKYFTKALIELPWAAIKTFFPPFLWKYFYINYTCYRKLLQQWPEFSPRMIWRGTWENAKKQH